MLYIEKCYGNRVVVILKCINGKIYNILFSQYWNLLYFDEYIFFLRFFKCQIKFCFNANILCNFALHHCFFPLWFKILPNLTKRLDKVVYPILITHQLWHLLSYLVCNRLPPNIYTHQIQKLVIFSGISAFLWNN